MLNFFKTEKFQRGKELETFFITFDEPLKDSFWQKLRGELPHARRVDSVKGFDRAHKACAEQVTSKRFISIDGDNELLPKFHQFTIPQSLINSPYVLSWAAINSVNGLIYGNGGVKCWPTDLVHKMQCHENSNDEKSAVDFCFQLQYYLMPDALTKSVINSTPFQAFRAGFREGIKMALLGGEKIKLSSSSELKKQFTQLIPKSNLERLRVWCTIGEDVENGLWSIYGARRGLWEFYVNNMPLENIRDYDWFENYWREDVMSLFMGNEKYCPLSDASWSYQSLKKSSSELKESINDKLNLQICDFDPMQSLFFKATYKNSTRRGLLK